MEQRPALPRRSYTTSQRPSSDQKKRSVYFRGPRGDVYGAVLTPDLEAHDESRSPGSPGYARSQTGASVDGLSSSLSAILHTGDDSMFQQEGSDSADYASIPLGTTTLPHSEIYAEIPQQGGGFGADHGSDLRYSGYHPATLGVASRRRQSPLPMQASMHSFVPTPYVNSPGTPYTRRGVGGGQWQHGSATVVEVAAESEYNIDDAEANARRDSNASEVASNVGLYNQMQSAWDTGSQRLEVARPPKRNALDGSSKPGPAGRDHQHRERPTSHIYHTARVRSQWPTRPHADTVCVRRVGHRKQQELRNFPSHTPPAHMPTTQVYYY